MANEKPDFSDVTSRGDSTAPIQETPKPAPRTYTVVAGDSLSKIAKKFYGNANSWKVIFDANQAVVGPNPNLIKPGQVLTIPELEGAS